MKRYALLAVLLLLSVGLVFSVDFGFLLNQKLELGSEEDNTKLTYTPSLTPWFSWNNGQGLSVFLSGIVSLKYQNVFDDDDDNDGFLKPVVFPEISRFGVLYRFDNGMAIEGGRINYSDVLGVTAYGLFDGVRFSMSLMGTDLSVGLFYTGLLYKDTAKISMSYSDWVNNVTFWDYSTFGDYFASKRLLAAVRWDIPVLQYSTLSAEVLAQFDLNGKDDKLHSQYGEVHFDLFPASNIALNFGLFFEAMENQDGDFFAAVGGLAGFMTEIPGALNDGLKVLFKFSSGYWNDTFTGFNPLSSSIQGQIFSGFFSDLASITADYSVRILPSLFAEGIISYFMRTSDEQGIGILYGGEIWVTAAWQPFDDLRVSLGGGVFLPKLGNISPDDAPAWKISAALALSF